MIKTVDLSINIANINIVKGMNLEVKEGSFTGVIGPNGSGKSTLLKAVYRVLQPAGGTIYLDNRDITELKLKQYAREISVVSQITNVNFEFTVEQMVLLGRSPYKKIMERDTESDYEIVNEALTKVGLNNFQKRIFSTLSGGERQMVMLARALAQKTKIMILDEPTNHLDIRHQLDFFNILRNENITVFAVLHDLSFASMYCDYLYALKNGQLAHHGSVAEVLTSKNIEELFNVNTVIIPRTQGKGVTIEYLP